MSVPVTPPVHVVILAAGKGTRMKSDLPKVLHRVAGIPMIDYVLAVASRVAPQSVTVVIGYQGAALQSALLRQTRPFVLWSRSHSVARRTRC